MKGLKIYFFNDGISILPSLLKAEQYIKIVKFFLYKLTQKISKTWNITKEHAMLWCKP